MQNIKLLVCLVVQFEVGFGYQHLQALLGAAFNCDNHASLKVILKGSGNYGYGTVKTPTDPNYQNENGDSALHYAALGGCTENVKTLVSSGANVDLLNKDQETVLFTAVLRTEMNVDVVKILLKAGANVNFRAGKHQETPLHLAIRFQPLYHRKETYLEQWDKKDEIIYELLEAGADPGIKDANNRTALAWAFEGINRPASILNWVRAMLKHVSNPNTQGGWREDNSINFSLLHRAVDVVWFTPTNGDWHGWKGQRGGPHCLKMVKLLIDNGVNPNLLDKYGQTALLNYMASPLVDNHYDLTKFLLDSGTDPNITTTKQGNSIAGNGLTSYSNSVLQLAIMKTFGLPSSQKMELFKTIKLLLDTNADINHQNSDGESALHLALLYVRDIEMVKLLLKHKVDVNLQTNEGNTALHLTTIIKNVRFIDETYARKITNLLLKHGANPNFLNYQGKKWNAIGVRSPKYFTYE